MLKVLIVDDQPAVRTALETLFALHDLPTLSATSPEEALDVVANEDVGAVVHDMNFTASATTGEEGVALFRAIRAADPTMPVVMMTAWTSLQTAVSLMREGAADYIAKPWNGDKLVTTVRNLVSLRALNQENLRLQAQSRRERKSLADSADLRGLVYESRELHAIVRLAATVAPTEAPVMITGPNGSGKEKIAEIVQANSRRRSQPFVRVNVGALPDELFEAELFGAEAGAFTGAQKLRIGRFEAAHGGTLFLDELGTLSMVSQAKLLRVLQTGEFERLGSSTTRKADVRILSATNADLPRAIAAGTFREDLFFRLNVIELQVPALGDRPDDVMPLAEHFLARFAAREQRPRMGFSESAVATLLAHDWPGNVRELENRVQRAVAVQAGHEIGPVDLGLKAARQPPEVRPSNPEDDAERASLKESLARAGNVVSRAAAELGISRQALYRKLEKLGMSSERRAK
jgi:DNA-binding NtrC family response regulator